MWIPTTIHIAALGALEHLPDSLTGGTANRAAGQSCSIRVSAESVAPIYRTPHRSALVRSLAGMPARWRMRSREFETQRIFSLNWRSGEQLSDGNQHER